MKRANEPTDPPVNPVTKVAMAVFFPQRARADRSGRGARRHVLEANPAGAPLLAVAPPSPPRLPEVLPGVQLSAPEARPSAARPQASAPLGLEQPEITQVMGANDLTPPEDRSPDLPCPSIGIEYVDPLVGATLDDRYRIDQFVGAGAIGRVYQGVQVAVGRTVAIKVLNRLEAKDEATIERFRREARVQAQMTHPNIVHLIDFGRHEDTVYLVMEFVDGRPLRAAIRRHAPFDPARASTLMVQLLRALAAAHGRGAVHRDLKPANLLIVRLADGREVLKVADFGLAMDGSVAGEAADEAGFCGSPRYMSPEQAALEEATAASDIYAFGAIVYEMLTGQYANPGRTTMEVVRNQLQRTPPRVQLDDPQATWMLDIALECLACRPEDRPASAVELLTRLEQAGIVAQRGQEVAATTSALITDPSIGTVPPSRLTSARPPARRRKRRPPLPLLEILATLIVAGLVWVGLDFVERLEADRANGQTIAAVGGSDQAPADATPRPAAGGVVELPAVVIADPASAKRGTEVAQDSETTHTHRDPTSADPP